MKTIDDYIDLAKKVNNFKSDSELDRAIKASGRTVSTWRTKRAWPSDEKMIVLAELAKVSPEIALLDLGIWRSEGQAAAFYTHMRELLEQMPNKLMNFIAFATLPAFFDTSPLTHRDS